jgi:hypothetical protein
MPAGLLTDRQVESDQARVGEFLRFNQVGKRSSADGLPICFEDTQETEAMRTAVLRINATNTPDRITLPELDDRERWALWEVLCGEQKAKVLAPPSPEALEAWFSDTALYRVFNDGSFDLGGRFYGAAWQQMPKAWRSRILIDSEPTTELDFGSLHPRMAHNILERLDAPQDCYAGIHPSREIAKRAVSALLNMENGTTNAPRWFRVEDAGMPWKALAKAARAALPAIASHFGTGAGLRLQRVDSDIAEAVMLHFASRDIPCLGVHDSFIVQQRHADELKAVMRAAYRSRIGFESVISRN